MTQEDMDALIISIRAPARGATPAKVPAMNNAIFQSALPRGERLILAVQIRVAVIFQSALPRGERRNS